MQKIRNATRIELELMDREQRRQLNRDYRKVEEDCRQWEEEEHDRKFFGHDSWRRRAIYLCRREICRIDWFVHDLLEEIRSWF